MKPLVLFFLLVAAGLRASAAPAAGTPPVPAPAERPLAERIDALLRPHLKPTPLPVMLPNPFIIVRGTADFAGDSPAAGLASPGPRPRAAEAEGLTDSEKLAQAVAKLRIGGTIKLNDVTHLIVNQVPYREGAMFMAEAREGEILLQIVHLTPEELVLGFRDVTQAIRLKNPPRTPEPEK